jgi:thymidylate synthase
MRFDLSEGFPLLTTKRMWWRGIVEELLWILSGSTDEGDLRARGVDIWKEWATPEQCARFGREPGDLGPVYGHLWRRFGAVKVWLNNRYVGTEGGVDQIAEVVRLLIEDPNSRRIILTGWDPAEVAHVALPPCHTLTQFVVRDGKLSTQMYQRSADVFLGVPFNIASYALLTHMLAHVCDLAVGEFIHTFGDVHIYRNHEVQVAEQLCREPRPLPKLSISTGLNVVGTPPLDSLHHLLEIDYDDLTLDGYDPWPKIAAEVSV